MERVQITERMSYIIEYSEDFEMVQPIEYDLGQIPDYLDYEEWEALTFFKFGHLFYCLCSSSKYPCYLIRFESEEDMNEYIDKAKKEWERQTRLIGINIGLVPSSA